MAYSDDLHSEDTLQKCAGSSRESGVRLADGSHGYTCRYTENDAEEKIGGVCMPSPCALGCSFDREAVRDVGRAVGSLIAESSRELYGDDAARCGVNAVLSPDVGIVRSPLYGGLADRFGEDPYLCGALGIEWVNGAQSTGVAAVLSHFGGGTQANGKYTCDHKIDARALAEMYLRPFEMTVKQAAPRGVACALSKINGVYAGENDVLLTDILRRRWGFDGAVLADMRQLNPVEAMACGVDVSCPKGSAPVRRRIRRAVREGELPSHYPARCADRVKRLTRTEDVPEEALLSEDECRDVARRAAESSAVLLKNHKHLLPLPLGAEIALIGRYAKYPRIQRGGRDALTVDSDNVKNMLTVFDENQVRYRYCDGFDEHSATNEALLAEAVKCAAKAEFALVLVGFDDDYDNNSADRFTNQLPKAQAKLIHAVARANPNTVVVVNSSALPRMNWIGRVKSVLYMPVGGEEVCPALFRLLFGMVNPSGRLSVSYSLNETELPSGDTFGRDERMAEHWESIYVGYRYFNKANLFPAFPFGYGLSYTKFAYGRMRVGRTDGGWRITLEVRNVGTRDGAEVVQLYVEPPKTDKFRPLRELKQFEKVFLARGEKRNVTLFLPDEAFTRFDPDTGRRLTVAGRYRICAAASSADMRAEAWVVLSGETAPQREIPAWYRRPSGRPSESDFQALYGKESEETELPSALARVYSVDNTLNELSGIGVFHLAVKAVRQAVEWRLRPESRRSPAYTERLDGILNMPLHRLCGMCGGWFPMKLTLLALFIANRRGGRAG